MSEYKFSSTGSRAKARVRADRFDADLLDLLFVAGDHEVEGTVASASMDDTSWDEVFSDAAPPNIGSVMDYPVSPAIAA